MEKELFSGPEIIDLCESIMEIHRALKVLGIIFSQFDFETDNGNAFQGKIQKVWFRSVINEMIETQFEKMDRIREIYQSEQAVLE